MTKLSLFKLTVSCGLKDAFLCWEVSRTTCQADLTPIFLWVAQREETFWKTIVELSKLRILEEKGNLEVTWFPVLREEN